MAQQLFQPRLSLDQWQRPQVFAIQEEQVEGEEYAFPPPEQQIIEHGTTRVIDAGDLAINDSILDVQARRHQKELQSLARQSSDWFTVKVRVSDKELPSFLSRASMLLYVFRLEAFGLAPLEANACGMPVVAIAEGGVVNGNRR
jgi:glycosyltransferase involved in cell wall biosynthesis